MEELSNYNIRGYNFSIWLFRIILLIVTTVIILLLVLNINETVSVREGEIVASSPQSDYKAPFEAQLIRINVKVGQQVNAGDTLLIVQSEDYTTQYSKKKTEIEYLQKKIQSTDLLQQVMQKKKAAMANASAINANKYQLDVSTLVNEIAALDKQYKFQKERLSSADERFVGDSILFKKDMLSKSEYNNTRDANLVLKENISNVEREKQRQLAEKNLANNNFSKEQNAYQLQQAELNESQVALLQSKNELESQLIQANEAIKQIEREVRKQYVIAKDSGRVNFVFNTLQTSNLITKGDLLVSVAPKNFYYYAKAIIPQKDIPYLRSGLEARLKLDAYYQFEYGVIRGRVSYIAERKENEKFYALIELPKSDKYQLKSGYTIQGEIIVKRMPLIKYFIKKLFKRLDT